MQSSLTNSRAVTGKVTRKAPKAVQVRGRINVVAQALRTEVSRVDVRSKSSGYSGGALTSSQLASLKIDELISLCHTKKVDVPRNATRTDIIDRLVQSGVAISDLSKGQLGDMCMKLGLPVGGDEETLRQRVLGASPQASRSSSPAPSYGNGNGNGSYKAAAPAVSASGAVSEAMLNALKTDALTALCASKKIAVPRNASRADLTKQLLSARLSVSDLSKGQLGDIAMKFGLSVVGDEATLRARIAGGSTVSLLLKASSPVSSPVASRAASPAPVRSSSPAPYASSGASATSFLNLLKADELTALCRTKRIDVPRTPSKDALVAKLSSSNVTVNDLSKGQLMEIAMKMNLPYTGDEATLRARITGGSVPSSPAVSRSSSPAPVARAAAPAAAPVSAGSSDVLSLLKIEDLVALCRAKQIALPRTPSRPDLLSLLKNARVSVADLNKSQLADVAFKLGLPVTGDEAALRARIGGGKAPVSAAASPVSSRSSSPAPVRAAAPVSSSSGSSAAVGAKLLSLLKADELTTLCRVKRIDLPRTPTKESLVEKLSAAKLTLNDLPRGVLGELAMKLGLSSSGDEAALRARIATKMDGSAPVAAPTAKPAAKPASRPSYDDTEAVSSSGLRRVPPPPAVAEIKQVQEYAAARMQEVPKPQFGTPKPYMGYDEETRSDPTPSGIPQDYSDETKAVAIATAVAFVATSGMIVYQPDSKYSMQVKSFANTLINAKAPVNQQVVKEVSGNVEGAVVSAFKEGGAKAVLENKAVETAAESAAAESVSAAVKSAATKDAIVDAAASPAPAVVAGAEAVAAGDVKEAAETSELQTALQEAVSGAVMGAVEGAVEGLSGLDVDTTTQEEVLARTETLLEGAIEGAIRGAVAGAREGAGDTNIEEALYDAVQSAAGDVYKYSQEMWLQEPAEQDSWLWDSVPNVDEMMQMIPDTADIYETPVYNTFDMNPEDAARYAESQ